MRSEPARAGARDTHVKSSSPSRLLRSLAIFVGAGAVLAFAGGCATTAEMQRKADGSPQSEAKSGDRAAKMARTGGASAMLTTGRVFTRADMQRQTATNYFGDQAYAEVNSAWLSKFHEEFRRELHRLGITRWNERFDCNRFVDLFIALAQARYYRETFHSDTPARALAMGPYWYVRDNGQGTHAVVQVLTERGRIFVDPQSGEEVQLTRTETALAYFQFF